MGEALALARDATLCSRGSELGLGPRLLQHRLGQAEGTVSKSKDPTRSPWGIAIDEVPHDLEGDLGNRIGADRHPKTTAQDQRVADEQ